MYTDKDVHPYSFINACDVLMVPSIGDEDFPNVMLIAMMYRKPIIASGVYGLPEMIDQGNSGFVAGNEEEIMACMNTLLDERQREHMSLMAMKRFEQLYRPEKIIQKYMEMWKG